MPRVTVSGWLSHAACSRDVYLVIRLTIAVTKVSLRVVSAVTELFW
jgi:hypothetical protein